MTSRSILLLGAAVLVLDSTSALAQQADTPAPGATDAPNSGLTEIVVSARKVSENLQDVPVAVTAFSTEKLEQMHASELSDIARMTPGLTMAPSQTNPGATLFQLRGQFQTYSYAAVDPSVGVYVDGLYWARAQGVSASLLDIANIQVLKGPQGTLFGRNTTGGAVVVETANPDFNGLSGYFSTSYGRFDATSISGVVNAPIIHDRIAFRAAFQRDDRDGYVTELNSGKKLGSLTSWIGRAKLLVKATDTLSSVFSAEMYKSSGTVIPLKLASVSPTSLANLEAGLEQFGAPTPTEDVNARFAQGAQYLANYIAATQDPDSPVRLNRVPGVHTRTWTYQNTTTLDTFFGAVKFIGGLRRMHNDSPADTDGSPVIAVDGNEQANIRQYSGELQVTGRTADRSLDFAGGLFYFDEKGESNLPNQRFLYALSSGTISNYIADLDHKSLGIYAQASYHLTDALTLNGGLRYSIEDKRMVAKNTGSLPSGSVFCLADGVTTANDCAIGRHVSFSGVSYMAGIDYRVDNNILLYAKSSKGLRSGGLNSFVTGDPNVTFVPFKPETVFEQSAGMKSEFFDRRLRVNFEGFYSRLNDVQRVTLLAMANGALGSVYSNAGKARIYGFEAEVDAALFDGFTLSATAAMTKAKYLEFIDPGTGVDRRKERFQQTPPWSFSVSGNYARDLVFAKMTLNASYSWQDKTPTSYYYPLAGDANTTVIDPSNGRSVAQNFIDATTQKAAGIINARAALTFGNSDQFEVAVFGENLTDNRDNTAGIVVTAPINIVATRARDPRTFGISAKFRFGS